MLIHKKVSLIEDLEMRLHLWHRQGVGGWWWWCVQILLLEFNVEKTHT